jgi:transglutaminase-like putative cysteine protease
VVEIKGDAIYGSDFRVMAEQDILTPMMVKLTSYPDALREVTLPEATRQSALQLPKNSNPQSVALAKRLFAESASKQEFINRVMIRYRKQEYYYTLRPKRLGNTNTIDEFLINNKKGFCAHYAGSFVFLMRAVGIPARVVTGYQGGAWNEKGKFLSIRQYDAHAWTEVWLENRGWIRFDPTSMVAPSRIEQNLEEAVAGEGSFLEGKIFSLSKYQWLNSLKDKLDSTQYAWRKFVLGYDNDTQASFLKRLFGELSMQKMAMIVGGFFLGIIVLWSLLLGLGRKQPTEATEHQLYRRFCALLDKHGAKREPSQTPSEFSKIASALLPNISTEIYAFSNLYSELCYNPDAQSKRQENIATLNQLLKRVRASV